MSGLYKPDILPPQHPLHLCKKLYSYIIHQRRLLRQIINSVYYPSGPALGFGPIQTAVKPHHPNTLLVRYTRVDVPH